MSNAASVGVVSVYCEYAFSCHPT